MSRKDKSQARNFKSKNKKIVIKGERSPENSRLKKSVQHAVTRLFEQQPAAEFNYKQIAGFLDINDGELFKLVYQVLVDFTENGFLKEAPKGTFSLDNLSNSVEGKIELTQRGAGYVVVEGQSEDVYIAPTNTNQALPGDLVTVRLFRQQGSGKPEGVVTSINHREKTFFVGTLEISPKFAFVVADNQKTGVDIFIPIEKINKAKDRDKVLAKITSWPKGSKNPYGEIIEILGRPGTNDAEMLSILYANDIDPRFPEEVLQAAEQVGMELDDAEIAKRRDFREITTFTIDPVDAKDFDDAISVLYLENGNVEIGVHIADVSHYVTPGTPMDAEALKRGNSVYLVDRVVPMLPEQLSNLACSLRPKEDKYTFSAVFELDMNGDVLKEWFGKTVIHSNHRFSYEDAQEIIEGTSDGPFKKEVMLLDGLAKLIRGRRLAHGAMNIESEETRFLLDEDRKPVQVITKVSKDAHKLIEEFMLLANKHVAIYVAKPASPIANSIPFVYRCHDKPDPAKIQVFRDFINKFGHTFQYKNEDEISKEMNKLFKEVKGTPEFSMIQSMAIRSMAKANYDSVNIGHYGLAFEYYTHFTSPIRRYADLVVHRILFEELTTRKHKYGATISDICKHISRMERKAVDSERESTKYFQVIFVKDFVGDVFNGTVSGVSDFGMFVKMDDNQCEGMVSLQAMNGDRYNFDQKKHAIIGSRHKKEFSLGDKVMVKLINVNVRKRQIDLELLGD